MANQVLVTSAVTINLPFSGIACDVYGNQCQYLGSGNTIPFLFNLPTIFDTAPAIGMKLIDSSGCELFEIIYCTGGDINSYKQFQDSLYFVFMDSDPYQFQD